jgi:AraC-like DNA-binding protein
MEARCPGFVKLTRGFYDQAHLTRDFRRRFDETPRGYRNRHRSR